jgi:hypothetical protein
MEGECEARMIMHEYGLLKIPKGYLERICFGLHTLPNDIELVKKLASEFSGCEKFLQIIRDNDSDFGIKAVEI